MNNIIEKKQTNTALLFFLWLFGELPAQAFYMWVFFLKFVLKLFSVPLLIRTFFSTWHRYGFTYPKGLDVKLIFQTFFGNIMSRVIGMILRTLFIVIGLMIELVVFIVGGTLLLAWIMLPFLSFYLLYKGIILIV